MQHVLFTLQNTHTQQNEPLLALICRAELLRGQKNENGDILSCLSWMRTRHGKDRHLSSTKAATGNTDYEISEPAGTETQYQGSGRGQSEINGRTVTRPVRLCILETGVDD